MKRFILPIMSLVAIMTLGAMPSYLPTTYAAPKYTISTSNSSSSVSTSSSSSSVSRSAAPTVVNVKVDGTVTIWSDGLGISPIGPVVRRLHTSAKFVPDPTRGIFNVTVTNLSIPWFVSTGFTLQDGKVGSGIFRPSTNAANMTLPLQVEISTTHCGCTSQVDLSTDGSLKTATGQIIRGRRIDPDGRIIMVGSASYSDSGLLDLGHAQVRMQSTLSPWPLTNPPAPTKKPS